MRARAWIVVPLALVLALAVGRVHRRRRPGSEPDRPSTAGSRQRSSLTFGVWGTEEEIEAYQDVVDTYNATHDEAKVKIKAYPDPRRPGRGARRRRRARRLPGQPQRPRRAAGRGAHQPIGDLLDERDVDFGDGYSRPRSRRSPATASCSACPTASRRWSSTTTRKLVDFEPMAERELDVPTVDDEDLSKKPTWTLEQFQAAAEYASRPRRGDRRLLRRPDAARAGAVHLLRRRRDLRRRRRADLAGLLLRRHPVGARAGAAAAARPQLTLRPSSWPRRRRWSGSGGQARA